MNQVTKNNSRKELDFRGEEQFQRAPGGGVSRCAYCGCMLYDGYADPMDRWAEQEPHACLSQTISRLPSPVPYN